MEMAERMLGFYTCASVVLHFVYISRIVREIFHVEMGLRLVSLTTFTRIELLLMAITSAARGARARSGERMQSRENTEKSEVCTL